MLSPFMRLTNRLSHSPHLISMMTVKYYKTLFYLYLGISLTSAHAQVTLTHHKNPVSEKLFVSPQLGRFVTHTDSDRDTSVVVWNTESGKALFGVHAPFPVSSTLLTDDGKTLILAPRVSRMTQQSGKPRLSRWNIETGESLPPLILPEKKSPSTLVASANGKYILSTSNKRMWIWRASDAKLVFNKELNKHYSKLVFLPNGKSILACSLGGIDEISLPKGNILRTYTAERLHAALDITLAPDNTHFVAAYTMTPGYRRLAYWKIGSVKPLTTGGAIKGDYISRVFRNIMFSKDGRSLHLTGYFPGALSWGKIFTITDFTETPLRFRHKSQSVFATDIISNNIYLISAKEVTKHDKTSGELTGRYSLIRK